MPSLRKRVSTYLRQLSFHHEPHEKHKSLIENTFITKYLQRELILKEGPAIHSGKVPLDLPSFELGVYKTGPETIIGCFSGPDGGLTGVKRKEKHLSLGEQDIDFIDTQDEQIEVAVVKQEASPAKKPTTLDNTTMVIKMAGQEYFVTNRRKSHSKSHSLGSLKDFADVEVDKTKRLLGASNNNNEVAKRNGRRSEEEQKKLQEAHADDVVHTRCDNNNFADDDGAGERDRNRNRYRNSSQAQDSVAVKEQQPPLKIVSPQGSALAKSKSEGNPFRHQTKLREGRIRQLAERPSSANVTTSHSVQTGTRVDPKLPAEWNRKSDFVYGISDSLYDKNLSTKAKNGNPIADCFGVITRSDSAILAVADGVNWGEKAAIAAKSAVHGCLHYLNKTIFLDTRPFDNLINKNGESKETPVHESRTANSRDIFVCLLRAFNCAHDLILENNGMLTTLTVAVVLPLKDPPAHRASHVACVCNVGDSLAYVYSQKQGIRELTKGSHDITSNRDMRDALGALGPVDGIKPELSNLTLSVTTLQTGDIVMVASDGLTDNFDPTVCRFAANMEIAAKRKPTDTGTAQVSSSSSTPTSSSKVPQKPPRKNSKRQVGAPPPTTTASTTTRTLPTTRRAKPPPPEDTAASSATNPLVAQFLQDNAIERSASTSDARRSPRGASSSTASPKGFALLRSKTALDFRHKSASATAPIARNADGLPYVTPVQRYELTLLLIEDVVRRGVAASAAPTARRLCEGLVGFALSVTAAKRRTLEDNELYFNNQNGVLVEASNLEKKMRRKRALERVQHLPGKLDHVTVVACNVGNRCTSSV